MQTYSAHDHEASLHSLGYTAAIIDRLRRHKLFPHHEESIFQDGKALASAGPILLFLVHPYLRQFVEVMAKNEIEVTQ